MFNLQDTKCPNCGAKLCIYPSHSRATCQYCGSNYYIESPGSFDQSVSQSLPVDNPEKIKIVRDEGDYERELLPRSGIHECFIYNATLKKLLCLVSGVSYVTKKSYSIAGGKFWSNLSNSPLCDNYREPRGFHRPEKMYKSTELQHRKYMTDLRSTLTSLGIVFNEKTATYKNDLSPYTLFDAHSFTLQFPVISPSYFQKHFEEVYRKYNQIKDYEAVDTIVSVMSSEINTIKQHWDSETGFFFDVQSTEVLWKGYGAAFRIDNRIWFRQVKMDNIESETVILALQIAIIEKLLNKTASNGKNMFDLDSRIYLYSNPDSYDKGLRFRYLESCVREYKKW